MQTVTIKATTCPACDSDVNVEVHVPDGEPGPEAGSPTWYALVKTAKRAVHQRVMAYAARRLSISETDFVVDGWTSASVLAALDTDSLLSLAALLSEGASRCLKVASERRRYLEDERLEAERESSQA